MTEVFITGISSNPGYNVAVELLSAGNYSIIGQYYKNRVQINSDKITLIKANLEKDLEKLILDYKPSIIIHTAAIGSVDYCEENPGTCYQINTLATRKIANVAYKIGSKMVYLSTDYVFDGVKGLYKETDTPRPINVYGLTKLLGEESVLTTNGIVVRTSAIFGPGPGRPNFAKVLVEKLRNREKVFAAFDQYLSPTYSKYLANAIKRIIQMKENIDIIHVSGPRLSRYRFALLVGKVFDLDTELIEPVPMAQIPYKAPRPLDSSLDNSMAVKLTGIDLNNIIQALEDYKGRLV